MKAIGNREKTKLAFSSVLVTGNISKKEAMVSVNERIVKRRINVLQMIAISMQYAQIKGNCI